MFCPNCKKVLKEQDLIRKVKPVQRGFVLSNVMLFCPECNVRLAYPAHSLFFSVLGFIIFILVSVANLTMDFLQPVKIMLIILASLAMLASGYYRIHYLNLKIIADKT